jgi:hypothetical protein
MQAKHFAIYVFLSHDTLPVDVSLMTLHDVYLRPFRVFVTHGGGRALMVYHPPIRYVPTVANRWLLTSVLRCDWGSQGTNVTVASDCGDVGVLCVHDGTDPAFHASRDTPGANWGVKEAALLDCHQGGGCRARPACGPRSGARHRHEVFQISSAEQCQ